MMTISGTFARAARRALILPAVALLLPAAAHAQAAFTLQDQTGLKSGTYQIYVTGFSTGSAQTNGLGQLVNPTLVLQGDGSWATPATPTGTVALPCYRFPQDITQVQINGAQAGISARVYYFIVTDLATFPQCAPSSGSGLFLSSTAFTYSAINPMNLSEPATVEVSQFTMPAWTYSEIGASSANGTNDLSQVDFYTFPMNSTANVLAATPANPAEIGNPVGTSANPNPGSVVNHKSIRESYRKFIDGLAATANGGKTCLQDSTPAPCAYLDLLQDVTTPRASVSQYVIQNPGGYLGQYTSTTQASRLNGVFNGVIDTLWSATSAPTLVLDTGGSLPGAPNNVPRDTFTSSMTTIVYPGTSLTVNAMKLTGTTTSNGMVVFIVSPKDYETGCQNQTIPNCVNTSSRGYQVFAGAGVFDTPSAATYNSLSAAGYLTAAASSSYGQTGYSNVAARLAFLVSGAMNRGVALVNCPSSLATWQCWQDETYWYPTATAATNPTFPDLTQNLFSRWMHTATIGGVPMFVRPPNAVQSASSVPGGGRTMGMAYGFSNDENPTPSVTSPAQAEVPSKFDGTIVYGASAQNTITFGPWEASQPTLTVIGDPAGTVTSSPGDIDCGSTCQQTFAAGTVITLTAQPEQDALFVEWRGACTGSSTTCTVTLNQSATVTAVFGMPAAAPPANHVLSVVTSGGGAVTSAPSGIQCGSACTASFPSSANVVLTAAPAGGGVFAGWSGACSGTAATCTVPMSQLRKVGATFAAATAPTVSVTGGVGGTVTSVPGGVDCGTRCVASFASGTAVTLVARPQPGYRFGGWTGACSGTQACDLTLATNAAVAATFVPTGTGQFALTVRDFGEGTIQSQPSGIACGTNCSAAFPANAKVTLVATPKAGYMFAGWTGACTGAGACTVFMDEVANVNAYFAPVPGGGPQPVNAEPIPTLSEWALALTCLLLVAVGAPSLRRVQRRK
ncbi:MAG: IPTL-CTERM sorting domain-containing protein [Burkholderiales bacterium]